MTQTAMQELKDILKEVFKDDEMLETINWHYFFDREYKQIIDARVSGLHQGLYSEMDRISHQEYFKETYHDRGFNS